MSPLLLVGMLTALCTGGTLGDVKHALDDAHQRQQPLNEQAKEINRLALETEGGATFWWNEQDSPLKQAADSYKRSSSLSDNPFLNGDFAAHAPESSAHLTSRDGPQKIDLSDNPFFNGGKVQSSGQFHAGSAADDDDGDSGANDVLDGRSSSGLSCKGVGYACVRKRDCQDGVVAEDVVNVRSQAAYCDPKTEICCRLGKNRLDDFITAGKSSVPGSQVKILGNSPALTHVLPGEPKLLVSNLGETGADINQLGPSTAKPTRDAPFSGSTIDYSNVQFSDDVRFGSTIRGPAYLPPKQPGYPSTVVTTAVPPTPTTYKPLIPSTPGPFCRADQQLINGRCEQRQVQCGQNQIQQGGVCVNCPAGQRVSNGRCVAQCRAGEQFVGGRCVGPTPGYLPPTTPQPPSCAPYEQLIGGRCVARPTPGPSCGPYEQLVNGRCVPRPTPGPSCGPNEQFINGRCVPRPTPPPSCAPYEQLVGGRCVPRPTPAPSCAPYEQLINGRCVPRPTPGPSCGPYEQLVNGRCVPRPTPGPSCGPTEQLINGRCVPRPTPPPSCAPYEQLVGGRCVPRPTPAPSCGPYEQLVNGRCVPRPTPGPSCGPYEQLVNGRCVPRPTPGPSCGPSEQLVNGRCVPRPTPPPSCAPYEQFINGRCVPRPTPAPSCGPYEQLVNGRCVPRPTPGPSCGPFEQLVNGRCVPRPTPGPSCGPSEQLINGRCVPRPTPQPTCAPYEELVNGRCVLKPTQPPRSCAPYEELINGRCVPRPTPGPSCAPYEQLVNGRCVPRPTPGPSCAFNEQLINGRCVPRPTPGPSCAPYEQLVNGRCVPRPTPGPSCAPYEQLINGRCVPKPTPGPSCAPYEQLVNGRCVPRPTPGPSCAPYEQLINGRCVPRPTPGPSCGPYEQLINGRCVPRPTPPPIQPTTSREYLPPKQCAYNQVLQNGVCVCTGNTYNQNGRCVPITTPRPPQTDCPPNTYRQNGRCVPTPPGPTEHPGYQYSTPTPAFTYPTPRPSYQPTLDGSGSNVNGVFTPTRRPPIDNNQVPTNNNPTIIGVPSNNVVLPSCAAALKCVQEIYCSAEGFISPVPVVFSREQELSRVPLTDCADQESGTVGKCCRDPDYKDPWPSANLVNGVDNGAYREDPSLGQYRENNRLTRSNQQALAPVQQPTCGTRNYDTQPKGPGAFDAHFAEIPWQAMILRDTNRSLLCGGAIIRNNAVLTAAHCVEGLEAHDVLVKGGEWKLGIDEEPLPFQIITVRRIIIHPGYDRDLQTNDLALLLLEDKLRPTKNVGTICLPQPNQPPTGKCITTGWGKSVLQVHLKDAIMRKVDVDVIDEQECKNHLQSTHPKAVPLVGGTTYCGRSNADQCKVDIGSAMACTTDGVHYTLAAIFSWDTGCKDPTQIGGYVLPDVQWIEATLSNAPPSY